MKSPELKSVIVLFCVAAFTVVCGFNLQYLQFDYDFEKFYPEDDPETKFFQEHRERFASDNDFLLIAVKNEEGVFQKDFLLDVQDLIQDLDTIENIDTVISLTLMNKRIRQFKVPYINYENLDSLQNDSIWISKSPDVYGQLISKDFKTLSLYVSHTQYLSTSGCNKLADAMTRLKAVHHFDEFHIAGRSVGQTYYVGLMQKELGFFTITSFILLLIFLIIAFRSWWGVVLPVIVVVISVVWILGIMAMIGKPINLVLTVLPTIMFVVGMSDVIHIVSKYLEELRLGKTKIAALRVTVREVGMATLLTSVTTAIGFLTLYTSKVIPIRDFGLYVAFGVMIAFVLSFLVLPAMFTLIRTPKVAKHKSESTFWTKVLGNSFKWTIRNQWKIGIISVGVVIASLVGMSNLEVNNFLLEDLKEDDPLNQSFIFFGDNFSGVRPLELSVSSEEGILTPKNIRALDSLERLAVSLYPNESFISPVTAVKAINRLKQGGANMYYEVPDSDKDLNKALRMLKKRHLKGDLKQFLSDDGKIARLSTTVKDLGGNEFRKLHREFDAQIAGQFPQFNIAQTGTAYLIDKNNQYLSTSMMWSLAIAFAVVALIVGILFKSIRMVVIGLIPNIFPLIMIAGIMGFMGIDIKVSTSILFTIAFGIAVDDTIHFLSKLKIELNKGKSMIFAVRRTYMSTGRAVVLTTGILCAGFLTLVFSSFLGTFYMGMLITLSLLFALISDLYLLPILVLNFYKPKQNRAAKKLKDNKKPSVEIQ
jgi:predicted RND superfamily exporter protein